MPIWNQILEAFILGAIGGAVPGPIMTGVFTEIMDGGLKRGARMILKAMLAETVVVGAVLSVLAVLDVPQVYFEIISILGALFLVYLALQIWKIDRVGGERGEIFTFSRILILTILNGGFLIFWLTVCAPKAFALGQGRASGEVVFVAAFEAGWLFMISFLAFVFSGFRQLLLRRNLVSSVFKFFALVLVFFAIKTLWGSAIYLLG